MADNNSTIAPDALADFQAAQQSSTPAGVAPDALKDFQNAQVDATAQKRWAGRKWIGDTFTESMKKNFTPQNALLLSLGAANQGVENFISRAADTALSTWGGRKQVADQMSPNTPMEYGDVLSSVGAPETVASTLGLLASAATPGPHQLAGLAENAAVSGAANATKAGIIKGIAKFSPSLINKPTEAVSEMLRNPDTVFTDANMKDAPQTAQALSNELSNRIIDVKSQAKSLYRQAGAQASSTPVNPAITSLAADNIEQHLGTEWDAGHASLIRNTPAWSEPASGTTYSQTHSYIPPSTLVDASGNPLTYPGQQELRGSVVSKNGPNTERETQITGFDSEGNPYVKGVQKTNSTSDKTPMQTVTVQDAIQRMKEGQPVTVKQLAGLHSALQNMGTTTSGNMADEVSQVLAGVDPNFAKANQAWSDYKVLDGSVARPLYGGIKQRYNSNIPQDQQVIGQDGTRLQRYFDAPRGSETEQAPALADKILSQYGPQTNFEARIRALSAGSNMNEMTPRGKFAVGSLVSEAGPLMIAKMLPASSGFIEHPATQAALAGAGLGMLAGSSKGVTRKAIQLMTSKNLLPGGFKKMIDSPAGQYLGASWNPASLATQGYFKNEENSDGGSSE